MIPPNSGITMHVASKTFTAFKLEKSLISGNSVNINIDCLASLNTVKVELVICMMMPELRGISAIYATGYSM